MNETFLYTLPQWFVFAAIFVVVYGWVEQKKVFRLIGSAIFILLGIYSIYIILGDYFAAANFLTPEEIASEELEDEILNEVPFLAKLLPAYWSFVVSSVLAIPALILDLKNKSFYRLFIVITALVSLLGFFIVVGAVKSL
ncbi:MAG: hypothetical protein ABFS16_09140 [Bacteroidota bacterium]